MAFDAIIHHRPVVLDLLLNPILWSGLAVLYLLTTTAYSWYRLRHLPGPITGSISYLWMFRKGLLRRQGQIYYDVVKQYGDPVRVGPNDVITGDPEVIRRINSARSNYQRSSWYAAARIDPYHDNLFSMLDTKGHDRLKGQMSYGYGGKEVPSLETDIDQQLASFINLLRCNYISTGDSYRPLDLATTSSYFTLDVITKLAYGVEFGYLKDEEDKFGFIKTGEEVTYIAAAASEIPVLGKIFTNSAFLALFGPKDSDKQGVGPMLALAKKVVAERFGENAKHQDDMLGSFVRHGISQSQLETEIPFQIIAGSDTTAGTIRGTMLLLMTTPQVYYTLREEIDAAIQNGRVSEPIRNEEAKKLDYLQAVIYEGLRLALPVTELSMKQVPPEGDTIHDTFIPGGTRLGVSVMAVMRNNNVFGNDADVFRPERWLGIEETRRRQMISTVELSFGYGRYGCSGKQVAFMELNKFYFEVFRNFDFQLANPNKPFDFTANAFTQHAKGLWVRVTERTHTC